MQGVEAQALSARSIDMFANSSGCNVVMNNTHLQSGGWVCISTTLFTSSYNVHNATAARWSMHFRGAGKFNCMAPPNRWTPDE